MSKQMKDKPKICEWRKKIVGNPCDWWWTDCSEGSKGKHVINGRIESGDLDQCPYCNGKIKVVK